ncbi:MAG: ATP-dependent DNA helicase RecG [Gammaproteobacteria bacterium]|nr:MAG: ATP-dependent DNA helicase RecG [Gammaproteobacteria bacterium]
MAAADPAGRAAEPLLDQPLESLRGVGPALAGRLARLGLQRVADLLFHLPLRYEDRTRVVPIAALRVGATALVEGEVIRAEVRVTRRRMLLVCVADRSGALWLRFFHFNARQQAGFRAGVRLWCFGEVRRGPTGLEMVHPEYRLLPEGAAAPREARLRAIYPTTEGVSQRVLQGLVHQALDRLDRQPEALRDWLAGRLPGWPGLREALEQLHRPPPGRRWAAPAAADSPARRRLAFEELLAHHLSLRQLRVHVHRQEALPLAGTGRLRARLLAALPFSPTPAQQRVMDEIAADLARPRPMLRLVQGDVGSGKTLVAAMAALQAAECEVQTAVMAPTELLAEQHFRSFQRWCAPLGVPVVWLSGRQRAAERRAALEALACGTARIAVGTHALFQEDVRYARLGLVIVDEQHRFGVHQRLALRDKGARGAHRPHQLTLTATPIPRTLAMALYADLDTSIIDALPPGRRPVKTAVIDDRRREEVIERVRAACRAGAQAYWVCTLIEESEALQCQAAEDTARALAERLPELRVGLVHGRMKPREKEAVMQAFEAGAVQLLVATTVIEVGVDVPNASLMIIENAERLGLAQLHQLRGRVGRGTRQSHCVLLYRAPLSAAARARLQVMRETHDGFEIARRDLELRGPGEVLGTRQTGMLQFRVADLMRDQGLLPRIQREADRLLAEAPEAARALVRRWLGARERYAHV